MMPKPGMYRHFKGGLYLVLGYGTHSETLKPMVIYKHVGEERLWVRPLHEWNKPAFYKGQKVKRFRRESDRNYYI